MSTTTALDHNSLHEMLASKLGMFVEPLEGVAENSVKVSLPGGDYVIVVRLNGGSVTVSKFVSKEVDYNAPGLAAFLLADHGQYLYGRYEKVGESGLAVEHSITMKAIMADNLAAIVLAVHHVAVDIEKTLIRAGVLVPDLDESDED